MSKLGWFSWEDLKQHSYGGKTVSNVCFSVGLVSTQILPDFPWEPREPESNCKQPLNTVRKRFSVFKVFCYQPQKP